MIRMSDGHWRHALVLMLLAAALLGTFLGTRIGAQPDDGNATLDRARARMYRKSSAEVWSAVPETLKAMNLTQPRLAAGQQFVIAWSMMPLGQPRERRSELRVFVSPFAEPARVYVGSIMRDRDPENPRMERLRYNAGELEAEFFRALERRIGEPGENIPVRADTRAAAARRLLGGAGDAHPCLTRLEQDDSPALDPENGVSAPQKIPESDVTPVGALGNLKKQPPAPVRVEATITEDGAVIGSRVLRGQADERYTNAVLDVMSLWHYRPVTVDGCRVPARITLAVNPSPK
jgi:TonB family protein